MLFCDDNLHEARKAKDEAHNAALSPVESANDELFRLKKKALEKVLFPCTC